VQTARDGIEAGALSEAQLKAIAEQLRDVNLLRDYAQAMRAERAIQVLLLSLPPAELNKVFRQAGILSSGTGKPTWQFALYSWFKDLRLRLNLRSRGWVAANLAFFCRTHQDALDQLDPARPRIHAAAHSQVFSNLQQALASSSSESQLAAIMMPNFPRAAVTTARHQTQLHQLRVACALERYRLAHGHYPDKLDALIPDFLDRVPNDLFADRPLQYRREETGYQLWSVGWDEKDNGGTHTLDKDGKPDYSEQSGDWVWRHRP
jgi:hypothetical protein